MTGNSHADPQVYDFSAPVDLTKTVNEDPLFLQIVSTAAFRRLREIRFLGGIDYLIVRSPNGAPGNVRYTRFQHSLGVARLALMYASACELSFVDRRLIFSAALLHDIGHAPLSHSLEPSFYHFFGIDHHQATRDILRGHVPIGRELYKLLRNHEVDIDQLIAIISGKESAFHSLFSGPINFDTIEGILRTKTYAQSVPAVVAPELIVDAATNRSSSVHRELVDGFWISKDLVYRHLINSRLGVLADEVCQSFLRQHIANITAEDYFSTEEQVFRKLPGLRQLLTSPNFSTQVTLHVPEAICFKRRRFFIDQTVDFFARLDDRRYFQTKEQATLEVRPIHLSGEDGSTRDLFGDEGN
jgi:putative nucleotidyltransferase with HDIG domain